MLNFEYTYSCSYLLFTLPFQNPFFLFLVLVLLLLLLPLPLLFYLLLLLVSQLLTFYHKRDSEVRKDRILQYNQLLTFLIQECFNGGALHDRLKKKNIRKVQKSVLECIRCVKKRKPMCQDTTFSDR